MREQEREFTGTAKFGHGGDSGEKGGAAEEFGDEKSGVALSHRTIDPHKTASQNAGIAASFSKNSTSVAAHGSLISAHELKIRRFFLIHPSCDSMSI